MISSTATLCSITLGILRETGASVRERPQQDRRSPRMVIRKLIVLVAVSNEQGQVQSEWPGEEGQEGLAPEMLPQPVAGKDTAQTAGNADGGPWGLL